jgi:hypothetical protein
LADPSATQSRVDAAYAGLVAAINGLVIDISNPKVKPLIELLSLTMYMFTLDESDYNPVSWANLMSVVTESWDMVRLFMFL